MYMGMFGSRGSFLLYMPVKKEVLSDTIEMKCIEGDTLPAIVEDIHCAKMQLQSKIILKENDHN